MGIAIISLLLLLARLPLTDLEYRLVDKDVMRGQLTRSVMTSHQNFRPCNTAALPNIMAGVTKRSK